MKQAITSFLCLLFWNMSSQPLFGDIQDVSPYITVVNDSIFQHRLEELRDSITITGEANTPLHHAHAYFRLGQFYYEYDLYAEALENYDLAFEARASSKEKPEQGYAILVDRGTLELKSRNLDAATSDFTEAIEWAQEINDSVKIAEAYGLLGGVYEKLHDYEKALSYQGKSLELHRALKNRSGLAIAYSNLGSIYEDQNEYALALEYFSKANDLLEERNSPLLANVLNNLGDVSHHLGNLGPAITFYKEAIVVAEKCGDIREIRSSHDDIAEVYAEDGQDELAYQHLLVAYKMEQQISELQNSNQLNVLNVLHQTRQRESQIELLERKNEYNIIRQRALYFVFAVFLILVALFIFYLRKRQRTQIEKREFEEKLLKAEIDRKEIEELNLRRNIKTKTTALSRYSLHLSQKNKMLDDISNEIKSIMQEVDSDTYSRIRKLIRRIEDTKKSDNDWEDFKVYFEQVHPDFLSKLMNETPVELTQADIRIAMLLRLNLSSKEMASILRVSPDSIRVSRHRLRKKLKIEESRNLSDYLMRI